MSIDDMQVMVYDTDLKAPACVLLQAAYGCGARPAALKNFDPKHWITYPTPGMRKIAGTPEQWTQASAITAATWGDKRPRAQQFTSAGRAGERKSPAKTQGNGP